MASIEEHNTLVSVAREQVKNIEGDKGEDSTELNEQPDTTNDNKDNAAGINDQIYHYRTIIECKPNTDLEWALAHFSLGCIYKGSFDRSKNTQDIELIIEHMKLAVDHVEKGYADLHKWQNNLAEMYKLHYDNFFNLQDLEQVLKYVNDALINTPMKHSDRARYLDNLGVGHAIRYERLGNMKDLENAHRYFSEAVMNTPVGDTSLPTRQGHVGSIYSIRYHEFGNFEDLKAALKYKMEAVMSAPAGHPSLAWWQSNLGTAYRLKYERHGNLEDLEAALKCYMKAAMSTPAGHPQLAMLQNSLGIAYRLKYERHDNLEDLEAALKYKMEAVMSAPAGHPSLAGWQSNLGTAYLSKYERHGNLEDLEAALKYKMEAVMSTPAGHPQLAMLQSSLGIAYELKYQRHDNLEDLEAALKCYMKAVMSTPAGHPHLPGWQSNLGNSYYLQFKRLGNPKDLNTALYYFQLSSEGTNISASRLLRNSITWALASHAQQMIEVATRAYTNAFDLLPQVVWLGIHFQDRQHALKQARSLAVDAAACYIQNNECKKAVEFLEQGRFVLFSQLLQLRNGFDELQAVAPDLYFELSQVSKSVEVASHIARTSINTHNADNKNNGLGSVELSQKWTELVSTARELPGLSNFLKPQPFSELSSGVANGTAVILNCSQFRCDALIIKPESASVHVVPLSHMSLERAMQLRSHLAAMGVDFRDSSSEGVDRKVLRQEPQILDLEGVLGDLYSRVVSPVVSCFDDLKITSNRIWWCPTGAFTSLPFHAALIHGESVSGKAPSHISSYTPTLGSLKSKHYKSVRDIKVLAVAVSHTQGQSSLPQTLKEVECITEVIDLDNQIRLIDSQVSRESIIEHLPLCDWAHFSCHGIQDDKDPLKSGLLMPDGQRLELSEILKLNLPRARLVFLSACQTGLGDVILLDEALHMAGGFIFAGFQGAIATLWSIHDEDGPVVAKEVYSFLTESGNNQTPDTCQAAEALHHAVLKLRAKGVSAQRWAPFIHMGI